MAARGGRDRAAATRSRRSALAGSSCSRRSAAACCRTALTPLQPSAPRADAPPREDRITDPLERHLARRPRASARTASAAPARCCSAPARSPSPPSSPRRTRTPPTTLAAHLRGGVRARGRPPRHLARRARAVLHLICPLGTVATAVATGARRARRADADLLPAADAGGRLLPAARRDRSRTTRSRCCAAGSRSPSGSSPAYGSAMFMAVARSPAWSRGVVLSLREKVRAPRHAARRPRHPRLAHRRAQPRRLRAAARGRARPHRPHRGPVRARRARHRPLQAHQRHARPRRRRRRAARARARPSTARQAPLRHLRAHRRRGVRGRAARHRPRRRDHVRGEAARVRCARRWAT